MVKEFVRISEINNRLLDVLTEMAYKIIEYAEKHDLEIPYEMQPLIREARQLIHEQHHPKINNKSCSFCDKLNPEGAQFCAFCGTSLIITRVRQQDDNTRKSDRTISINMCPHECFSWHDKKKMGG